MERGSAVGPRGEGRRGRVQGPRAAKRGRGGVDELGKGWQPEMGEEGTLRQKEEEKAACWRAGGGAGGGAAGTVGGGRAAGGGEGGPGPARPGLTAGREAGGAAGVGKGDGGSRGPRRGGGIGGVRDRPALPWQPRRAGPHHGQRRLEAQLQEGGDPAHHQDPGEGRHVGRWVRCGGAPCREPPALRRGLPRP